jgi:hypothetical protein
VEVLIGCNLLEPYRVQHCERVAAVPAAL